MNTLIGYFCISGKYKITQKTPETGRVLGFSAYMHNEYVTCVYALSFLYKTLSHHSSGNLLEACNVSTCNKVILSIVFL